MTLTQHPLSSAFPAMSAEEFASLKDSIEAIGVQAPAVLFEGMVIDGWHRYTAAQAAGVNCPTVELGDVDPRDFVLAQNKARRHLTASQRALATAAVYEWHPAHREKGAPGAPLPMKNEQLAEIAGVSKRTIQQAKTVEASASREVKDAVRSGEISVKRGAELAQLPKSQQPKAMREPTPARDQQAPDEVAALRAEINELNERIAELGSNLQEAQADNESMARVFEADDKVAAAVAEAKRYREQVRVLEERVRGLMSEKNEAIRAAKSWQRKAQATA